MILVTGASGHVGGRVVDLLAADDVPLRLMTRSPETVASPAGAEVVFGDYAEPDTLDPAFAGVDVAFIVSGYAEPGRRAELHKNAIDAAAAAGVGHVVYLSFQGAAPDSKFPMARDHHLTEQHLDASGLSYTALRDNLYLDLIPEMLGAEGVIRGPGGTGQVAWVAREDVARCVAAALRHPESATGIYDVTGPEALTLQATVERLSALVGRSLLYEDETVEDARAWRQEMDVPDWEVDTWVGSYEAIAAGELAATSPAVERLTGRAPYRLEDYFVARPILLDPLRAAEPGAS